MKSIPRFAPLRLLVREALMTDEQPAAPLSNPNPAPRPQHQAAMTPPAASDDQRRVWQSTDLLGTDPEALIVHRGQTYRLRCTKQGKLILYK